MTSEGLPRRQRLTRAPDLQAVLDSGQRRRTPRLDIAWRLNDIAFPRLGVIVPRYRSTAVARNRLRRRVRELARRRLMPLLPSIDVVIRARPAAYQAQRDALDLDLEQWLRSLAG